MNIASFFTPKIERFMNNSALLVLFCVTIVICLKYANIIVFGKLSPYLDFGLWIYIFINLSSVSIGNLIKKRNNPLCPQCGKKLEMINNYRCIECGDLKFNKEN